MALEVLTPINTKVLPEHGHLTLFGRNNLGPWNNMPQDSQGPSTQPPTTSGADSSLPGALHSEASSSGDGMPPPSAATTSSGKKRKPSKPKLQQDLRRVASTPHIRGLAQTETSPLQSPTSDKRRNKLGYHRTSVACGHCRRRKIRCLVASDDPHGRCLNCIRLKKDCHFFPVDQGPSDPKSRPSASGSGEKPSKAVTNSNNSSPRTSAASDSIDDPSTSQGLPLQEPFSVHSSKQSSELDFSGSPLDGAPFQSPTFSYQGMPDGTQWGSTPAFYGSQTVPEDPNTPQSATEYWPQQHPPGSAIFQHRGSIPVGLDQSTFYVPQSEASPAWGAMRSMSVGDVSGMPHLQQFQQAYRQGYQASPYPYAFTDGSNSSLPIAAPEQEPPIPSSAPHILPSQNFPQGWTAFPADQVTPVAEQPQTIYEPQWYAEPATLASMDDAPPTVTDGAFVPTTHPG
ncbi:hypothetical protein NA57DRAFT_76831 [Rhizodiscina lignyota]|uniref:Zn(2)-C6 fungal-type domain-containing protein n=1 Tax=Rhizodiscina lignyota TaxID=1504668 RepID=A0A9P4M9R1_9PEZI|nr:hypothetical protein NA57DRAFT_76831 [Rhizodiscina lignyota]